MRLSGATVLRFNSPAELSCLTDGQGRAVVIDRAGQGRAAGAGQARQKDLGNFRIWFSGHGFQDLGSQVWGLGNFRTWFSGLGISTLGPGKF